MPYKKVYFCLFNAITDALRELDANKPAAAKHILQTAQQKTEKMYVDGAGTEEPGGRTMPVFHAFK